MKATLLLSFLIINNSIYAMEQGDIFQDEQETREKKKFIEPKSLKELCFEKISRTPYKRSDLGKKIPTELNNTITQNRKEIIEQHPTYQLVLKRSAHVLGLAFAEIEELLKNPQDHNIHWGWHSTFITQLFKKCSFVFDEGTKIVLSEEINNFFRGFGRLNNTVLLTKAATIRTIITSAHQDIYDLANNPKAEYILLFDRFEKLFDKLKKAQEKNQKIDLKNQKIDLTPEERIVFGQLPVFAQKLFEGWIKQDKVSLAKKFKQKVSRKKR